VRRDRRRFVGLQQESKRNITRLLQQLGEIGNERGQYSEARVESALQRAKEESQLPPWLKGFRRATPEEDLYGVDFLIWTVEDFHLPLQVKSSLFGVRQFLRSRSAAHFGIVLVSVLDDDAMLLAKIVHALTIVRAVKLREMDDRP
jgi:hypothetical protein